MSLGTKLCDAVKFGNVGVVKELLKNATANDVNWIGKVSRMIEEAYFCKELPYHP